MNHEQMTEDELRAVMLQGEAARTELNKRIQARADAIATRLKAGDKFDPAELRYAAYNRCPCGAGLAYPKATGMRGYWECSAILTHTADKAVQHTAQLPFAFYEIKSEDQPSANGATTRPTE